ncbi:MAG: FeoB-associated Cys-rich membrane protein [Clostridia bacterium]
MDTIIVIAIIVAIIGFAMWYIIKEKKAGAKCIGCSYSKECSKSNCPSQQQK